MLTESDQRLDENELVLSGFDLGSPEKVARVGHELIDELEQIADRYPDAADAREESGGDMDVFLAVADLDTGTQSGQVVSKRIRWVDAALEAWTDFVVSSGIVSHDKTQDVLDRVNVDTRK